MSITSKDTLIQALRALLNEAIELHQRGAAGARLGRAQGAADGYMRALLDLGVCSDKELLRVVAEQRARRLGPASGALAPDADTLAA